MEPIKRGKPVSKQVEVLLRERILAGEYGPGDRLPSESDLAERLSVSRATVRTAMAALAANGLVIRRHGDGTYVNRRGIQISGKIQTPWEFTSLIRNSGRAPSIKVLKKELRSAAKDEAEVLDIGEGAQVLALSRVFLADNSPVILSQNVIPRCSFVDDLADIKGENSILEILRDHCNQEFEYAIADIQAAITELGKHDELGLDPGSPVLLFKETFYDKGNTPLMFAVNHYNDKALRLRIIRS